MTLAFFLLLAIPGTLLTVLGLVLYAPLGHEDDGGFHEDRR